MDDNVTDTAMRLAFAQARYNSILRPTHPLMRKVHKALAANAGRIRHRKTWYLIRGEKKCQSTAQSSPEKSAPSVAAATTSQSTKTATASASGQSATTTATKAKRALCPACLHDTQD